MQRARWPRVYSWEKWTVQTVLTRKFLTVDAEKKEKSILDAFYLVMLVSMRA